MSTRARGKNSTHKAQVIIYIYMKCAPTAAHLQQSNPPSPLCTSFSRRQVAVSQPHVEQLFAAQANLELRIARSLSLGRWLWRGVNFSELWATAKVEGGLWPEAGDDGGGGGGKVGLGRPPVPRGGLQDGGGRGVWVPWEMEAANSSPERLKVLIVFIREEGPSHGLHEAACSLAHQEALETPLHAANYRVAAEVGVGGSPPYK